MRNSLGELQHLLDAGPRRRRHRRKGTPVFAKKGETLAEYWDYTHRILKWADGGTPNLILDDGGDATLLLHLGSDAEKDPGLVKDTKATCEEEQFLFNSIRHKLADDPHFL